MMETPLFREDACSLPAVTILRLRISLGLKPLNMEPPKQSAQDMKRQEEEKKKQEQEMLAADMRARIAA
jgi:hypothetical protein